MQKLLVVIVFTLGISDICAQFVAITFQVNMNYKTTQGTFNPDDDFVDVAGDFNEWDGRNDRLQDDDMDGIYSRTIGGFRVGDVINFKFRINGQWNGQEEFPNGGPNREYEVVEGMNIVDAWYNDEIPAGEDFQISMSASDRMIFDKGVIQFKNTTAGDYASQAWSFPGGFPSASTEVNPAVRYDTPGKYDVALVVENGEKRDTLKIIEFVDVQERKSSDLDWWNSEVFYEIFVRSFYDSDHDGAGDINGIREKLDYLNDGDPNSSEDLGIGGIWLMPVHPSASYHGYDVTDYLDIHSQYGSLDEFRLLVQEAHERGIKIIIDMVLNHTSDQHPWYISSSSSTTSEKRPYYRWESVQPTESGPWGQQVWHSHPSGFYYGLFWSGMPDLNLEEEAVVREVFEIAEFWLNDVGVDGFRLDAVRYLIEDHGVLQDSPGTIEFWKKYTSQIKNYNNDALLAGEAWTSTSEILPYVEGESLDICFEFDLANAIIGGVNGLDASRIRNQAQQVFNVYPNQQFGTFLSNHDQNRVANVLQNSIEKNKVAAGIYLTLPGTPFIYYGEEIGMSGVKPDEFIRTPMQWDATLNAGFSEGSPWIRVNEDYGTRNVEVMSTDPSSIYHHYRRLIQIRNREPVLQLGNFYPVYPSDNRILSYVRTYMGESILIIINLSTTQTLSSNLDLSYSPIGNDFGRFTDLLSNDEVNVDITAQGISNMTISPGQVLILKPEQSTSTRTTYLKEGFSVFPNPTSRNLNINFENPAPFGSISWNLLTPGGSVILSGVLEGDQVPLGNLHPGIYILLLNTGSDFLITKVVKQ